MRSACSLPHAAFAALACALCAAPVVRAEVCKIAVTDLEAQGLAHEKAFVARTLTDALATTVAEASGCDVITRQDIASMLGVEADRQSCGGESSDSCLAELGSALGVERVVAGAVTQLGSSMTVTARLLNMKVGKVEARAEATTRDEGDLRNVAKDVGRKLFPTTTAQAPTGPPLLLIGAGLGGGGGVLALVGLLLVLPADELLGTPSAARAEKEGAQRTGTVGVVVLAVGGAVTVAGAAVAAAALVME